MPGTDTELIGMHSVISHREKQEFQLPMRNVFRTTVARISRGPLAEVPVEFYWQHVIAREF